MLEHSSAMVNAVDWMMSADTSHPQIAPPVPEYPKLYPIVEATEGNRPRTEKDTEKDSQIVKSLSFDQHGRIFGGGTMIKRRTS